MSNEIIGVTLAAGKSTRMEDNLIKVLHRLNNEPIISRVVDSVKDAGIDRQIVMIGHQGEAVRKTLGENFEYIEQKEQLGTGHALLQVVPLLTDYDGHLLVLVGDAPFITSKILRELIDYHLSVDADATILTGYLDEPGSYGRIIRDKDGKVERIVEFKNATREEREIKEVNSAIYCFKARSILPLLPLIDNYNVKGEYLLTDIIKIVYKKGLKICAYCSKDPNIVRGINTAEELELAEEIIKKKVTAEKKRKNPPPLRILRNMEKHREY